MVLLSKYYDYELKREAYKIVGEKGYARNTTTLLTLSSIADTTMDYCTATFTLNVVGDKSDSQIVIYDNGTLIPFTYNNAEYTYLEWSNQTTSEVTISVKLSYDVSHSIRAKYMGNLKCVQSKSKTVTITRAKPATARTTLTLTFGNSNRIYLASSNPSCNATLSIEDNSINPNANRNQTIKFYVDGVLNGSTTTNNSGVASYTFTNISIGKHTITASYEGSQYLFNTETSTELSKGYKVTILDYPRYVLNDEDITATAQLTDYFDNPISSKSLTFAKANATSLSVTETTDSEGKATITMNSTKYLTTATTSNSMYDVEYCVRYSSNEYSENVHTIDAQNMIVELDDSTEYITATNQTTDITGLVSPSRTGLYPVDVIISYNGLVDTVRTDNNGLFVYNYRGNGLGDTTVTASINSVSDTVDVEDLLQYWKANNVSFNKVYKKIVGEFRELTNGFKLEFPKSIASGGVSIGLGDGSVFADDFELSFVIVGSANITQIGVKQWKAGSSESYAYAPTHETVQNGDVIKAISEEGTIKVYKNDVEISSTTAYDYYPCIWIEGTNGAYVLFDNLKFKVI